MMNYLIGICAILGAMASGCTLIILPGVGATVASVAIFSACVALMCGAADNISEETAKRQAHELKLAELQQRLLETPFSV